MYRGEEMLGYTETDISTMQACIKIARSYLPPNYSNNAVREGLDNAFSLLEGLVEEGHVSG